jgi:phospholipid-binding lipoprotein MlaA
MRGGWLGRVTLLVVLWSAVVLSGCAYTNDTGESYDPWESFNRDAFEMNRGLDEVVTGPISRAYTRHTPDWLRQAIFNFFRNAAYGGTAINAILQGKIEQGLEDFERFVINSTFGLGGLVDFAGAIGLEAHEEDFDQTLAVWGIPSGPYLELPLLGPHTIRSALMILPNAVTDWTWWVSGTPSYVMTGVDLISDRARVEGAIRLRDETALDPYVFQREGFLQRRRSLIFDGNPPLDDFDLEPLPDDPPASDTGDSAGG